MFTEGQGKKEVLLALWLSQHHANLMLHLVEDSFSQQFLYYCYSYGFLATNPILQMKMSFYNLGHTKCKEITSAFSPRSRSSRASETMFLLETFQGSLISMSGF